MSDTVERVVFPTENPSGACPGVMAGDPSRTPRGLILLHAWWGLNPEMESHSLQMAREGDLVVMVPDLYRGKVAKDRETAGHYMADLDWRGAAQDVAGAARYLLARGCRKVGVAGFCMGGALSFLAAATVPELSAAVPFYGICKPHLADLTQIRIPVQGHFGEKDDVVGLSSPADYLPLNEKLQKAGVPFELNIYENAGHGFAHPSYHTYNEAAVKLATSRMYAFLGKHLA